jgi:hypothetical protein
MRRRARHEFIAAAAGEHAQSLQRTRDARALQAVVAMFSLMQHLDQPPFPEESQVHAGGRWAYFSDDRQFRARSRVSVYQTVEHSCARGFADGRRNARGTHIDFRLSNHNCMVDEARSRSKRAAAALARAPKPLNGRVVKASRQDPIGPPAAGLLATSVANAGADRTAAAVSRGTALSAPGTRTFPTCVLAHVL